MNIYPNDTEMLIHSPSGMTFALTKGSETTIGRKDPVTGIYPDIDLTPVDSQRSVARRQAKIYRRGGKFFVAQEIGVMTSTYLNGTQLEIGVPAEMRAGDKLRFGILELQFQI